MKVAFKPWFIGFLMLTILLLGEITIAQKRKSKETCRQNLENKDRTCEPKSCEAECVRRHKPGTGHCGQGTGKIPICICFYDCPP
ncbi:hypothetical protein Bca4012_097304 [Brassica carinata]|uniref:Knottin scorpion toxin-like domain-containing protein n=2 Tax=Brassica TaxID=3705 RepID=A0A0D3DZ39_BRAOL|nr:unnamed protein product [Brassica napus]CDY10093.1 BnaC08g43580D [Brassica napus]